MKNNCLPWFPSSHKRGSVKILGPIKISIPVVFHPLSHSHVFTFTYLIAVNIVIRTQVGSKLVFFFKNFLSFLSASKGLDTYQPPMVRHGVRFL